MAKGLSVYSSHEGAIAARKRLPRFKNSAIADGLLTAKHGVMKPTPSSRSSKTHCTWWVPTGIDVSLDFEIIGGGE